jgi:hypothetical protein
MQQQSPHAPDVVKDEISLKEMILTFREWWIYMLSKWKLIILLGIVGGGAGLSYALLSEPEYIAETVFVLENAKSDGGGVASIAAKFGLGGMSSSSGLFGDEDNIMVFLKSRTMVSQTLLTPAIFDGQSQLLINRYLQRNKLRDAWKDTRLKDLKFAAYPNPNSLQADSIITMVYKRIVENNLFVAKPEKDGNIIDVQFITHDELFSKAFAEKLIENATELYTQSKTKRSQQNVAILQRQVDSVRSLLDYAISGAASSSDAVPNLNPAFQRLKVPTQKMIVDVEMNKAILEQLVANLELGKIEQRRESPLVQIIDRPVLPLEKKKVGKLKGLVLGGILGGLLTLMYFTIKRYLKNLLA